MVAAHFPAHKGLDLLSSEPLEAPADIKFYLSFAHVHQLLVPGCSETINNPKKVFTIMGTRISCACD